MIIIIIIIVKKMTIAKHRFAAGGHSFLICVNRYRVIFTIPIHQTDIQIDREWERIYRNKGQRERTDSEKEREKVERERTERKNRERGKEKVQRERAERERGKEKGQRDKGHVYWIAWSHHTSSPSASMAAVKFRVTNKLCWIMHAVYVGS